MIVRGAAPWLLLPNARPQHIGTIDIDLDLNVDELSEGEYSTVIEMLEKHGYKRGEEDILRNSSYVALLRSTMETLSRS